MASHNDTTMSTANSRGPGASRNALTSAREEFMETVRHTIHRVMEENGYNRDRATTLILGQVGETIPQQCEDELNSVKQQYHLTHQQAARAFGISRAFTKLVKGVDNMSHLEAVKCLTEKLSNATFVNAGDVEPRAPAPSASSENTTTTRKMSEIHLPEISKHCPPSLSERRPKSPSKRSKSISGCTKTNKNKQSSSKMMRKRNLDEIGTANTQQSSTKQEPNGSIESRHRSDSVSEAVSAKIQKQDPSMMNGEKQSSRAKRRSTGSLDDSDAGPVVKRGRATTA